MKVVTEKFKPGTRAVLSVSGQWMVIGGRFWRNNSNKAKQTGSALCPACEKITEIHIWSFITRGKRCSNCGVLLTQYGAFFKESEVKQSNN